MIYSNKYNHRLIEKYYDLNKSKEINRVNNRNIKRYICVSMFPYPSGKIHMGHIRNYLINDVICRYKNILGSSKSVMYFGWDAFGLPAENAAIKNDISPYKWTMKNIKIMKSQIVKYKFLIDWNYEINTSCYDFYKWSQYFFYKLYKSGYIYIRKYLANWDPIDRTILADEQVIENKGWRSGAMIERKLVKSYFINVKKVANKLEENLRNLNWPNNVVKSQLEWIGKERFYYCNMYFKKTKIKVFFKEIYCILSKSKLVTSLRNYCSFFNISIPKYKQSVNYFKTNFSFEFGNKITKRLFIASDSNKYSKHDMFILVKRGVISKKITSRILYHKGDLALSLKKLLLDYLKIRRINRYKIRDWCISRQRTWGTPIPINRCIRCKKEYIYIREIKDIKYNSKFNRNSNKIILIKKVCRYCKSDLQKENDTLDTFFDSSWYFLMFINKNNMKLKNLKKEQYIDTYIGGSEHNILHLIYVRIFFVILKRIKIVANDTPIKNLITQGMVLTNINGKIVKMSKSLGGNIDPVEIADKYGADCVRMYTLFSGAIERDIVWNTDKINGSLRYIKRLWNFYIYRAYKIKIKKYLNTKLEKKKEEILYFYKKNRFNKVISKTMEMFKIISKDYKSGIYETTKYYFDIILALYPICPCFTSAIWKISGMEKKLGFLCVRGIKIKSVSNKKTIIYINGKKKRVVKNKKAKYYKYKYIERYKSMNIPIRKLVVKKNIINFVLDED
ncbi:class I tRNA ligase family protein [Candidatus Vidania fulgoroideae]|uniref:leucine--tRNA ligase n=1 Tax=Candidatus Vidania fulgoroideorum TaxID=881286 RepID=A0A974X7E7_9PROT|nr:class I tRNA ligase family protein [Candidatus Vidania fulgoroideae]